MALEEVVQAISLEGGEQIIATLERIADIGEQTFDRITKALEGGHGFEAFASGIAGVVTGLAAATAATVAFVESQDHAITSLAALSKSFGTTIEGIQGIKEGFAQAGVGGTELERGLARMQRTISQQWSEISRSVRQSADMQTRDQLAIQSAASGTAKAYQALSEAETRSAQLSQHQAEERAGTANSLQSAQQKLRETIAPGSVSKSEKDNLQLAEARLGVEKAMTAQREQAGKQIDAQIHADQAVKDAAAGVQKAKLEEHAAAEKAHNDELRDLPKIAGQLNSIAEGHGKVKGELDLTEVSAMNLSKAVILAAGGLDGLRKPEGVEVLGKMSEVFKELGDSADAMGVKTEIVQRLMQAGFRGGGAGVDEMVVALSKGKGAFDELIEAAKKSSYALTDEQVKAAQATQGAFASLRGEFSRVSESMAAMASPTVTAWFNTIKDSMENAEGAIHTLISGFEGIGAVIGKGISAIQGYANLLDTGFKFEAGTGMKLTIIAIASAFGLWPGAIVAVIIAIGELYQNWEKVVKWVHDAMQSVSDFVKNGEALIASYTTEPIKNAWNSVVSAVQKAIDRVKEFFGVKGGGGESATATAPVPTETSKWQGGSIGSEGSLIGAARGYASGGLIGAIQGFAAGGQGQAKKNKPEDTDVKQGDGRIKHIKYVWYDDPGEWVAIVSYTETQESNARRDQTVIPGVDAYEKSDAQGNYHAGGGRIRGPGSGTSDSILARLSNGEFVVRAAAVRAYGADLFERLNSMQFSGFALGGPVVAGVRSPGAGAGKGAGSTLNLQIGDEHFDGLHAPQDVAEKLTHYAISRQASATGRNPSWVG